MLEVLLQRDVLGEFVHISVHPGADEAGPAGILQHLGVLALAAAHHRGHHLDTGALGQGQYLVDDLIHRLAAYLLAAVGAVGRAHPSPQQTQIVVDFRHRAHGGARVLAGGLLVDGDGWGQALDVIHVGLVHLPQEHTGVGGQALHIPPLALGIDGVKGQGAFAGAGKARQHHQLIPGDGDIDVLQIVLSRTLNENFSLHGMPHFCNIWLQISVVKSIFNVNSEIIFIRSRPPFSPAGER